MWEGGTGERPFQALLEISMIRPEFVTVNGAQSRCMTLEEWTDPALPGDAALPALYSPQFCSCCLFFRTTNIVSAAHNAGVHDPRR